MPTPTRPSCARSPMRIATGRSTSRLRSRRRRGRFGSSPRRWRKAAIHALRAMPRPEPSWPQRWRGSGRGSWRSTSPARTIRGSSERAKQPSTRLAAVTTQMPSSLEIAQAATLRPIDELAAELGLDRDEIELYGHYKAKIGLSVLDRLSDRPDGKLIDVTAITPTPAGEGKTTTAVGLTQGLGKIGRQPVLCLREASLGP